MLRGLARQLPRGGGLGLAKLRQLGPEDGKVGVNPSNGSARRTPGAERHEEDQDQQSQHPVWP
jgi:hypothetical protein